eukprot:12462455-Alexandrium_andersonii.AAC.1
MSASLVGSEMCIRDSCIARGSLRCVGVRRDSSLAAAALASARVHRLHRAQAAISGGASRSPRR